jgi:formylmethanofuran dehydrogenase subunit E
MIFHGRKCLAMPMGQHLGAAAMKTLGVDGAKDGQFVALVELGDKHCAICFAEGVHMIAGHTFGKGNTRKLNPGKWA